MVKYAVLSDAGRVRLSNEDAACCRDAEGLFVISDGMGGLPAGGAASQVAVYAMPPLLHRDLALTHADTADRLIEGILFRAAAALSVKMHELALSCPGLVGWGATMVALLLRGDKAHVLNVGDSRAYLLRQKRIVQLTNDDSVINRILETGKLITADFEKRHRNLISQHMAMKEPILPAALTIWLKPGDRLLLCTDGLSGTVSDARIGRLLHQGADPTDACRRLIEQANAEGGPDNITALVVDYQSVEESVVKPTSAADAPPTPVAPPLGADKALALLARIETQLHWMLEASQQVTVESRDSARKQLKELLGLKTFETHRRQFPDDTPVAALHQACLQSSHDWRRQYDQLIAELDPLMMTLASEQTLWSSLLCRRDAAMSIRTLWGQYRHIERYYLSITTRNPLSKQERALHILIQNMHESARTLRGLLEFLPKFTC